MKSVALFACLDKLVLRRSASIRVFDVDFRRIFATFMSAQAMKIAPSAVTSCNATSPR
jgi:hypothetical protein